MKLTIGNLKGGVSKSTTALYAALYLSRTGRVLLVDADGTNGTCMDWSQNCRDWPENIVVVPWAVEDLAKRVQQVMGDYDHLVIDTAPQMSGILRQALLVTDELVVPVAPSIGELRKLGQTFKLAAEVDAISPVIARVLLSKTRTNTNSLLEARDYIDNLELPRMDAEVGLREAYALALGTAPVNDLGEFENVMKELELTA